MKLLGVIFADPEVLEMVTALMVKVIEEKAVVDVSIVLCHVASFILLFDRQALSYHMHVKQSLRS